MYLIQAGRSAIQLRAVIFLTASQHLTVGGYCCGTGNGNIAALWNQVSATQKGDYNVP